MAAPRGVWDLQLPNQGSIPQHLLWTLRVLTTGPPGKSSPQCRDGNLTVGCDLPPRPQLVRRRVIRAQTRVDPDGSFWPHLGHHTRLWACPPSLTESPVRNRVTGSFSLVPLLLQRLWIPAMGTCHTEFNTRASGLMRLQQNPHRFLSDVLSPLLEVQSSGIPGQDLGNKSLSPKPPQESGWSSAATRPACA